MIIIKGGGKVVRVLNDLKESEKDDVKKSLEVMVGDFADAQGLEEKPDIVIFEGDELTAEQRVTANKVDKVGTKGF